MPQVSSNEIPYNRSAQAKINRIPTAGRQERIIAEAERILFNPCGLEVPTSRGTQKLFKSLSIFLILLTVTAVAFFILPIILQKGEDPSTTPKTSSQGWKGQRIEQKRITNAEQQGVNRPPMTILVSSGSIEEKSSKEANSSVVGDPKLSRLAPTDSPIQGSNTDAQRKQSFRENRPYLQKGQEKTQSFNVKKETATKKFASSQSFKENKQDISYIGRDKISRAFPHPEPLKQRKVRDFDPSVPDLVSPPQW